MKLEGKKILLQAPRFFDLHIQLKKELEKQGGIVDYYTDQQFLFTPKWKKGKFLLIKKILYFLYDRPKLEARKYINSNEEKTYDIYICINGFSFSKVLYNYLKKKNPKLFSVLYLWDSCDNFDFKKTFYYFDKVFSFDKLDSENYKITYLPLFWVEDNFNIQKNEIFDLFFVGSLHSDRYYFLKKMQELNPTVFPYIKLYVKMPKSNLLVYIKYFTSIILCYKSIDAIRYEIMKKRINDDFITKRPISREDFDYYMKASRCVLDIALPLQTGISNRVITALAMGKKIITTNHYIKYTSFYNPDRIFIINREYPYVPESFIKNSDYEKMKVEQDILNLRIDNWLSQLLSY